MSVITANAAVSRPHPRLDRRRFALLALAAGLIAASPGPQKGLRREGLGIETHRGIVHFTVDIADTDASREAGLMWVKALAPDRGMLFDFKTVQPVSFWMKNTLIPLDMVFIAADGRVVSVAANARPMSEALVPSGGPILGVLEIAGGRAAQVGIEPGDRVRARMFHP
ncbi:MAG TPA: DUF192 domain-containing protein [Caulobacteraceae bacterium]|nr:DUF192 domain-containing protein [Caulobacteraceae bacterium]